MKKNSILAIIVAAAAVTLTSCSHTRTKPSFDISKSYVGDLDEYVDAFVVEAKRQNFDLGHRMDGLTVAFGSTKHDDDDQTIGLCYEYENRIVIDRTYWTKSTHVDRIELMFHELGHCVLKREHRKDVDKKEVPRSLMYPQMVGKDAVIDKFNYYMDELFHKGIDSLENNKCTANDDIE